MEPPPIDNFEHLKKRRFWRTGVWVSVSLILLSLGFGLGGTVIGMIRAFDTVGVSGGGDPGVFAEDISLSLMSTAIGLVVAILGIPLLILSIVKLLKLKP